MITMHKFGSGEVQYDPEDPQGVPAQEGQHTAAAETPEQTQQALDQENTQADSPEPAGRPENAEG